MITRAELPTAVGSSQAPTAVDNSVFHLLFGVHTVGTGSVCNENGGRPYLAFGVVRGNYLSQIIPRDESLHLLQKDLFACLLEAQIQSLCSFVSCFLFYASDRPL